MPKLLLFLLLLSANTVNAQFFQDNALYLNMGVSAGNYLGGKFGANFIHKEKYLLQVNHTSVARGAKSKPEDYRGGVFSILLINLAFPHDKAESYEVLFGRVVKLNAAKTIRLNAKGGPTFSKFYRPTNWQKGPDNLLFPNYTFENVSANAIGLIINPEIEFLVTRFFGAAVSPYGIFTKEGKVIGVEFKTIFGLLR